MLYCEIASSSAKRGTLRNDTLGVASVLLRVQKRPFSAMSASIFGIPCATYFVVCVSAQSLDFLDLAKNCSFLVRKLYFIRSNYFL
jgi:hypothetical protein